jgi:hypothetical protein
LRSMQVQEHKASQCPSKLIDSYLGMKHVSPLYRFRTPIVHL